MTGMNIGSISLRSILKARWNHFTWKMKSAASEVREGFKFLAHGEYVNGAFYHGGKLLITPQHISNLNATHIMPGTIPAEHLNVTGVVTTQHLKADTGVIFAGIGKDMIDTIATDVKKLER